MTYYYNDDALLDVHKPVFRRACEVWSEGTGSKLNFKHIDRLFDASDMNIIVRPVNYLRPDECGRVIHAANEEENNFLLLNNTLRYGLILDTALFSSIRRLWSRGFDLLSVFEHELGHILGLEHTDDSYSIMQTSYLALPNKPSGKDFAKVITSLHLNED